MEKPSSYRLITLVFTLPGIEPDDLDASRTLYEALTTVDDFDLDPDEYGHYPVSEVPVRTAMTDREVFASVRTALVAHTPWGRSAVSIEGPAPRRLA